MRTLADTHVLLRWFAGHKGLSASQRRIVNAASARDPLLVSDVSLWEVATLHELGRVRLHLPLRDWLERLVTMAQVERTGISPAVAAEVAALPSTFHRDPADRIIVASARVHGARLLTQDARIIASRLVPTVS
jgi:PIN domain nuclease of toxin-antitoxin system